MYVSVLPKERNLVTAQNTTYAVGPTLAMGIKDYFC